MAVYRGYVRPEDEPRDESMVQDGIDPAAAGQVDDDDTRVRPRWPMEELPPLQIEETS